MNNVVISKLVGELLIGQVSPTELLGTGESYKITQPLQIGVIQEQIAFIDFNGQLTNDKEFTISKSHVLYHYNASEEVSRAYYNRISNIQIPEGVQVSDVVQ